MATSDRETGISQDISLEQKVSFLKDKHSYPQPTTNVKAIKTHMSWVFLTDRSVYKLKIPFRYDHLKLLTPTARHYNCLEEVRLNKRLARDIYLGVTPLSTDNKGNLVLGEGKRVVDWLVKMKRLPEQDMLGGRIKTGRKISKDQLRPVAELLTRFYLDAKPIRLSSNEHQEVIKSTLEKSWEELRSPDFDIDLAAIGQTFEKKIKFVDGHTELLKGRIDDGRIVEGHGDLKPDHICLCPPVVIDCLEFSKQLRILDIIDDLAFLSLECNRLNVSWIGEYFINYYMQYSDDTFPAELLNFYKSYRATIRALLSIRHLREKQYQKDPKWRERTGTYLKLAEKYILEAEP